MGIYINPNGETIESYLRRKGEKVPPPSRLPGGGLVAVCLVDKGAFTAAGVAFDERERRAFQEPSDHRPRQWFAVPLDDELRAATHAGEYEWQLMVAAAGAQP